MNNETAEIGHPGTFAQVAHLGPVGTQRYTISIPEHEKGQVHPLLVVLHYRGTVTPYCGRPLLGDLALPALGGLGAIMVAPDAIGGDWLTDRNEKAVMSLVSYLMTTYPIDDKRLVVMGYSMGAVGTWHLVMRYPGLFSAAVPISGLPQQRDFVCATPVFALHSKSDTLFSADTLEGIITALVAAGCDARVRYLDGVDHFDVTAFREALSQVSPWIREVWSQKPALKRCVR